MFTSPCVGLQPPQYHNNFSCVGGKTQKGISKFLECVGGNAPHQVQQGDAALKLFLTYKESCWGGEHDVQGQPWLLWQLNGGLWDPQQSESTQQAHYPGHLENNFGFLRGLLGRVLCDKALERGGTQESLLILKDLLRRLVWITKEFLNNLKHKKTSLERVETGSSSLGGIQRDYPSSPRSG